MVPILFNSAELFEQNCHTPLTESQCGENWSEEKTFKDHTSLYMYILAQRQGR